MTDDEEQVEARHVAPGKAVFVHSDVRGGLVIGSGRELNSAIIETTPCEMCGQATGHRCVTKTGRRSGRVHMARFYEFWYGADSARPDFKPPVLPEE